MLFKLKTKILREPQRVHMQLDLHSAPFHASSICLKIIAIKDNGHALS